MNPMEFQNETEAAEAEAWTGAGCAAASGSHSDVGMLRERLAHLINMTWTIAARYSPEDEDTETVEHPLTNGDCRRIWEAVTSGRLALEESSPKLP